MSQQEKASPVSIAHEDDLPYAVELWDEKRSGVEKILARAIRLSLARAIFRTAREENPGRRIVLSHGGRILEENN